MASVVLHVAEDSRSDLGDSATSLGSASPGGRGAKGGGAAYEGRHAGLDEAFQGPTRAPRGLLVTFEDVGYAIPAAKSKRISLLDGITGFFEPGQVAAVMGPSGSGKTTFLDVLAGRKTSGMLLGSVRYGGLPPSRSLLRRATGYVEQFDTLVDTLSCQEMLLYTAQLKRPRCEPLAAKQAAVQALLDKLGLACCASTQIGSALKRGISGGQAKRLNIGIALITDPRVLFLDEPTSGLDSFTANEVMSVVAGLTRDGTTIATTIHSPSSYCFGLFDRLLVLMGGRMVYLGGAGEAAISYFTSCCSARQPRVGDNLAEWILETVTQAEREGSSGSDADAGGGGSSKLAASYSDHIAGQVQKQLEALLMEEHRRLATSASRLELQQLEPRSAMRAVVSADEPSGARRWGSLASASRSSGLSTSSSGGGGRGNGAGSRGACAGACSAHSESYVTPAWWGLKVLLQYRTLRNYCSPMYVLPRLLEKVLFAAVVLSLYWGKGTDFTTMNVPVLSSLLFLMVLAPMCSAVLFLPGMMMERALYIRERNDGLYRPLTYLLFKLLDELLLMAPVTAGTTAAVFFACKLQGSWLLFWLVGYATLANGTALSYFLASSSPTTSVAFNVLPFLLCMSLVLCGYMIRQPAVPSYWSWAIKLNVVHYSWGALMVNQYDGHGSSLGNTSVLGYFGLGRHDTWAYLAIVVAFFGAWSFLAWLALAFARNHKR